MTVFSSLSRLHHGVRADFYRRRLRGLGEPVARNVPVYGTPFSYPAQTYTPGVKSEGQIASDLATQQRQFTTDWQTAAQKIQEGHDASQALDSGSGGASSGGGGGGQVDTSQLQLAAEQLRREQARFAAMGPDAFMQEINQKLAAAGKKPLSRKEAVVAWGEAQSDTLATGEEGLVNPVDVKTHMDILEARQLQETLRMQSQMLPGAGRAWSSYAGRDEFSNLPPELAQRMREKKLQSLLTDTGPAVYNYTLPELVVATDPRLLVAHDAAQANLYAQAAGHALNQELAEQNWQQGFAQQYGVTVNPGGLPYAVQSGIATTMPAIPGGSQAYVPGLSDLEECVCAQRKAESGIGCVCVL